MKSDEPHLNTVVQSLQMLDRWQIIDSQLEAGFLVPRDVSQRGTSLTVFLGAH